MFRIQRINRFSILALLLWGGLGQAALHDRGNGLIYDDVLDVTWLQDANLAATETFGVSGVGSDGSFSVCDTGTVWINAMNAANYKGFNDWRLPEGGPVNGATWNKQFSYDGSTDLGYNISAPRSAYPGTQSHPLAHLFYQSLGNQGWYDVNGNRNAPGCPDDANGCLRNTGSFVNLQPGIYLSYCWKDPLVLPPGGAVNIGFDFRSGQTSDNGDFQQPSPGFYVLPYRPGDVPGARAVPVLSPWFLGALGGLLLMLGGYRLRGGVFR